jgi:NIMA-interacting peptidyl-prolyl cis-trans isomerase 4
LPLIFISLRHILCEKQGKVNEAYQKLQDGWLRNGDKVPPAEFAEVNLPPIAFSLKTLVSESLLNLDRN